MAAVTPPDPRYRHSLETYYQAEKALADRLRLAPAPERPALYVELYEEFFRRFPELRQEPNTPYLRRYREGELRFLRRFVSRNTDVLEIGCGDAAFGLRLAGHVRSLTALDLRDHIPPEAKRPANFRLVLDGAVEMAGIPDGSADLAYSAQFLEHLHPEDLPRHLASVRRVLRPGGVYALVTPQRFSGPHDISMHFSAEAEGFHLREYTWNELRGALQAAGFSRLRFYGGLRCRYFWKPAAAVLAMESMLGLFPAKARRRLARSLFLRPFFMNIRMAAWRE